MEIEAEVGGIHLRLGRFTAYGIVRVCLGVLLLLAAVLKGHYLVTEPIAGTTLLSSRWFLIALVEAEFFLGLWLLSGLHSRAGWVCAVGCFALFFGVSLYTGLSGHSTCGCLGKVQFNPWHMALLDLGALTALLGFRPPLSICRLAGAGAWKAAGLLILALMVGGWGLLEMSGGTTAGIFARRALLADESVHDFGQVAMKNAMNLEHRFRLRNMATRSVRLVKAESTCGCTAAVLPDDPTPPGGTGEILVKIDWYGKAGAQATAILLETDDPRHPRLNLTVRGFVNMPVALRPDAVNFGLMGPGETKRRQISLSPGSESQSVRILEVTNSSPNIIIFRLNADGSIARGRPLEGELGAFLVSITAPLSAGREKAIIAFYTNLAECREIKLPVEAEFRGSATAMPRSIFFSADAVQQQSCRVRVTARPSAASSADSASVADSDTFSAEVLRQGSGTNPFRVTGVTHTIDNGQESMDVTVDFNRKDAEAGFYHAILRVRIGGESLDVPIFAVK